MARKNREGPVVILRELADMMTVEPEYQAILVQLCAEAASKNAPKS